MEKLYIDTETYSEVPLKTRGTTNYAQHLSAEVMLFSYAVDDEDVELWDRTAGELIPSKLEDALYDERVPLVAHNAMFDRTLINNTNTLPGLILTPERIIDTMVQAFCHGLPGGLDKLCELFGLDAADAKMKEGRALIHFFCKPNKGVRHTRLTHPEKWDTFCQYAKSDITAMRIIHKKLPRWNYPGANFPAEPSSEHRLWCLDQHINDRGFAVDVELADRAIEAATLEKKRRDKAVQELTDGEVTAATQRDKLLKHILEAHGVTLPDLKADTLKRRSDDPDLPVAVRQLLDLRMQSSRNASAKYTALVNNVAADGRLHGTMQFCGAASTGRWGGRVFQPQNLMRPTMKSHDIAEAIELTKLDVLPLFYPNVAEVLGNCVRGAIIAPKGKKLLVSDLSAIEGRALAWLAREEDVVQFYHDQDADKINYDAYMKAYSDVFGGNPWDVDKAQRTIGKPIELACFGAETRVITDDGVKAIVDVTIEDKLWDGQQWVTHQGLISRGEKRTILLDGVQVTPDHSIKTGAIWQPAQRLASSRSILTQALETGSESLKLLASTLVPQAGFSASWFAARAADLRTQPTSTTYAAAQARAVIRALRKRQRGGEKIIGSIQTSALTTSTDVACLTESLLVSLVAKARLLANGILTAAEEFESSLLGSTTARRFFAICSLSKVGINRSWNSIAPTMSLATDRAIFALSQNKPTLEIAELSPLCNVASSSLKPVYDIAHAGPRNQFTILSDSGALVVHNCGYGGGVAAFITFALTYGLDLDSLSETIWENGDESHLQQCEGKFEWAKKHNYHGGMGKRKFAAFEYIKQRWRTSRPKTVEFWAALDQGFKMACAYESKTFTAGPIKFLRKGQWMRMRLPSGRCITFLQPKADEKGITFRGLDRYSHRFGRVMTHGGKLSGIVTQAFASDILREIIVDLECDDMPVVLTIHDEALCEVPDTDEFTVARMNKHMTREREWAKGLPLAADGFETYRYRKG